MALETVQEKVRGKDQEMGKVLVPQKAAYP